MRPGERPSALSSDRSQTASRPGLLRRLALLAGSIFGLLALAIVALLLVLHHRMQASLAPLDGTVRIEGLSASVTVRRDEHGVPHIEAANVDDLLFAQGWVTASDRLWQMDMARRLPAGEAAEILGPDLVPHDRMERTLGMRDIAERMVRTLPAEQLAQLDSYARGVNAYIAHGELPAEFSLLFYKPRPWRPVDSMLVALSMGQMLDERWQAKLKREQVTARLAEHGQAALAGDLFPTGSWRDHPPVPSRPAISDPQDVPQIPLDPSQVRLETHTPLLSTRALLAMDRATENRCAGCRPGSNEWAVSGAHTASGKPLLSNDMHLEHQIPDAWYETDLHAGSFHAAGVTVAGLPFISAGHNDHIAWGFTALGGDTQDIYVEQLNAQGQYRVLHADGSQQWVPLTHEKETIKVRGGHNVEIDVERTAHGPIITPLLDAPLKDAPRLNEKRVLTLHWALYDAQAAGLPLYALNTANDWTSFRAAMSHWWAPTLNAAYADDAGHIGYQTIGLIPIRAGGLQGTPITPGITKAAWLAPAAGAVNANPGTLVGTSPPPGPSSGPSSDPSLNTEDSPDASATQAPAPPAQNLEAQAAVQPVPGPAQPTAVIGEWTGYIPFDALPSVLDPEGGIVATANARVSPDGYPYQLTLEWAAPYRNERIWKQLSGRKGLTPADMLRLQTDVFSEVDQEIAQKLAYAIDHAAHPSSQDRAAADILRSWNGVLSTDSAAATIVVNTEQAFWPAVLEPKIGGAWRLYDWSESAYAREQMIAHGPAAWLPGAYPNWTEFLAALVDGVLKNAPGQLQNWHYGDVHGIAIEHPLWKLLPTFHGGVGPAPQSGDPTTVKQVTGNLGPSQRFTADLGDLDKSTENLVAGQSEDPASPYFRDQWPFWLGGHTFALPFSSSAVQASAQHTLHLVP